MSRTECYVVPKGKLKTLIPPDYFIALSPDRNVVSVELLKIKLRDLKTNGTCTNIYHLLEGSEIIFQVPQKEPRRSTSWEHTWAHKLRKYRKLCQNPELHARVERLKAEQANKEYGKMTKNLQSRGRILDTQDKADVKSVNAQIAAVCNFVFTVGGSFAFTYKAVEYALPQPNIPAQVLMGLLAAITVAIADLYFLIRSI